jgi:hypothetical protein
MPQGPEYVAAALERIQSASEAIGALEGVEAGWRSEALERLASVEALLRGTTDRFYLKTRVCLPFARKCEEAAQALQDALAEQPAEDARPSPAGQGRLDAALEVLEKAARTLDERSMMQGMAIT